MMYVMEQAKHNCELLFQKVLVLYATTTNP